MFLIITIHIVFIVTLHQLYLLWHFISPKCILCMNFITYVMSSFANVTLSALYYPYAYVKLYLLPMSFMQQ